MRVLRFEKIESNAFIPTKNYPNDACWDLYSIEDKSIPAGETRTIRTGLRFEVLPGEKLHIYSRSGLAAKHSIGVLNAPGVIDAGYTGEIKIILHNYGKMHFLVTRGSKIAQFSRELVLDDVLEEDVIDEDTDRGSNGFGSSGI